MIELLKISDPLQRGRAKRPFTIENMKDDALEKVAQREVVILGQCFQYFQNALFHPDASLDPFDLQLLPRYLSAFHAYLCTRVHAYRQEDDGGSE